LIARGGSKSSSKLQGHLQPLNLVDLMVVRGRGNDYAGAAKSLGAALNSKKDWDKIRAAVYILSYYKKLLKPGLADQRIFLLLAQAVGWLNAVSATAGYYQAVACLAVWKLLTLLGLAEVAALGECSPALAAVLSDFDRADLAEALQSWRPTAARSGELIVYLEKRLPLLSQ